MMSVREILFRGKRTDNGEWVYGYYCGGNERGTLNPAIFSYLSDKQSYDCQDINIETLGQYTGLTDKNGKKIFEGDIVKRPKLINDKYIDIKNISISVIDWLVGEACFTFYPNAECSDDCLSCTYCGFELEIIGNIHDNPELLEVES